MANDPKAEGPVASAPARPGWRCGGRLLARGDAPLVMGVVNVTPDSFSDGGRWLDPGRAAEHALRLIDQGAAIIDIGGESTRPGAEPVDASEELRRVLPVVRRIASQADAVVSIDTSKAAVAGECLAAGASIVNDVTGLSGDPEMLGVVAGGDCGVCVMHMLGTPRTMQQSPRYGDVVAEVAAYLAERRRVLAEAGVAPQRVAVDPGIGFGKTAEHNWRLVREVEALRPAGAPLLVGHSRKRFLGEFLGDPDRDRTAATIGVALHLSVRGVDVLRVHDVGLVVDALAAFAAACAGRAAEGHVP